MTAFKLLADLGEILVPEDYLHEAALTSFRTAYSADFFEYYFDGLTDENYSNPSRILKPSDRLRARLFRQHDDEISSADCYAFLESQNSVYLGAQGAALVFTQKLEQLPINTWIDSYDRKESLLQSPKGYYRVPRIFHTSNKLYFFIVGTVCDKLLCNPALLCFNEIGD
jgi:hypothetical protein